VACYDRLVAHLSPEQPFQALQSRGLTTDDEPYRRIEDMASFYLQAVRAAQPRGPYRLLGWSFGGLVAYEMARQLEAAGDEIALLALLDTHAPGRRPDRDMDDARTLTRFGRELGLALDEEELRRLGPDEMLARVAELAAAAGILPRQSGLRSLRRFLGVYKANLGASQEYLPAAAPLAGPVVFLSAGELLSPEVAALAAVDPRRGWSRYAAAPIRVHTVPGSHVSMVEEPYVRGLAEVLDRILAEAARESAAGS
jgi:thioesterase domain-containing protein